MTETTTTKKVKTRVEKLPSKVDDIFSVEAKRKDWKYRRILIFVTCGLCFAWITWAAGWTRVETANSLMSNAFNLLIILIPAYVGAAVTDDYLRNRTKAQYGGGGYDRETEEQIGTENRGSRWDRGFHRQDEPEQPTDATTSDNDRSRPREGDAIDPDLPASRGRN